MQAKDFGKMLALVLVCFAIIVIAGVPFSNVGSLDEGIYFAVSYQVSQGKTLYSQVPESKGPFFFLINALLLCLTGPSISVLRLFQSLVLALTALCMYQIAFVQWEDWKLATIAAVAFSTLASLPAFQTYVVLTEPLMVLLESQVLLLFSHFMKRNQLKGSEAFALGAILALSVMVRQSSVVFFMLALGFLMFARPFSHDRKRILWFISGMSTIILTVAMYFQANNALQALFFWQFSEPVSHVAFAALPSIYMKVTYFSDVFLSVSPWIVIALLALAFRHKHYSKPFLVLLLVELSFVPVLYLLIPIFPAFQHEYLELALPLSLLAPAGVVEFTHRFKLFLAKGRNFRQKSVGATLLLLASSTVFLSIWQTQFDITNSVSNDFGLVDAIYDHMNPRISPNESIYVYETFWPKISMYVYASLNRFPANKPDFLFPPEIDGSAMQDLIRQVNASRHVIVIGDRPPFLEARRVYDFIITRFRRMTYFGEYSPYPWLKNQPVFLFEKSSCFEVQTDNVAFDISLAPSIGVQIGLNKNQSVLTVEYETLTENWFSLIFKPNTSLSLDSDKFVGFTILKSTKPLVIQLDLADPGGNFSRMEFECPSEEGDFTIWLVDSLFAPIRGEVSASQIESINLSFVFPLGQKGQLLIDRFRLGHTTSGQAE